LSESNHGADSDLQHDLVELLQKIVEGENAFQEFLYVFERILA